MSKTAKSSSKATPGGTEEAAGPAAVSNEQSWLMKAEPETRLEKGKDVAFSATMFEEMGTSPWDGVRNHQAKNFMRDQMRIGDRVLFYHSNCKVPGIAALAEVCKEGYPDYTAWDPEHPYYDPKSDKDRPTWYMVNVKFIKHMQHFVSLKLLQALIAAEANQVPGYLSSEHVQAIRDMPLLSRGRLSVQPVSTKAYEAICLLGEKGEFEELSASTQPKKSATKKISKRKQDTGALDAEQESAAPDAQPRTQDRPKRTKKA